MSFFRSSLYVLALSAIAVSVPTLKAQAGFKFVAPAAEQMEPAQQHSFAPEPSQAQDFSIAAPQEPVVSEMLDDESMSPELMDPVPVAPSMQPMPIVPQAAAPMAPVSVAPAPMQPPVAMAPTRPSATGLIIDPYPLGPHVATDHRSNISGASVHKAMNEESGVAHPLPLGRNMSTMTKPVRVASARQEMRQAPSPRTSLVPMPGGIVEPEMPMVKYMDAVGFGRDLPLALALSQVVPPNYAFSFAEDDSAGATVSWEGGKPWDQVLDDMLEPHGLRAIIEEENKKVIISNS